MSTILLKAACLDATQRAKYPVIKAPILNNIRDPYIIEGIFAFPSYVAHMDNFDRDSDVFGAVLAVNRAQDRASSRGFVQDLKCFRVRRL